MPTFLEKSFTLNNTQTYLKKKLLLKRKMHLFLTLTLSPASWTIKIPHKKTLIEKELKVTFRPFDQEGLVLITSEAIRRRKKKNYLVESQRKENYLQTEHSERPER